MHLLLIDDNRDLIDALQAILELEDYVVDTSYDYDSAISLIENNTYDVIFIDGKLHNHNGFEIFDAYRQNNGQGEVVIMSAYRCEQLIEFLVSPDEITIHHKPDKITLNETNDKLLVRIVLSTNCQNLVDQLAMNSPVPYTLIKSMEDLNKLETDISETIIQTDSKVMENILLLYKIHQSHPDKCFTLLVDSNQYEMPLKDFMSCGCLLKPFEPEDMITIIKLLSASPSTKAIQS
ncbi:MAG: response regulator [Gammaproteobacteria bacterium]|nr:response regulator [Gammaproteobacteria bacterium]